jgi:nicotinamidase-related amidase
MITTTEKQLPIPPFFDGNKVKEVWRVPYQERHQDAQNWAKKYDIKAFDQDKTRICLMIIDAQNTFCLPDFELFVGGNSAMGAIEDNIRLCEFIYRNLGVITQITATLDSHTATQIFHSLFWVNEAGENPPPYTMITLEDIEKGVWKVNKAIASSLTGGDYKILEQHALHYVKKLADKGKYLLTIWGYHAMVGGIGQALVSSVEEALFFHNIARHSQTNFEIKGGNPLTENYSVLRPEVLDNAQGYPIAQKNISLIKRLLQFDAIIIAGQAKSHCVAWTVDDLLSEILATNPALAKKVYLLEDCTSPVVVPGVVDFTHQANQIFQNFASKGMHLVKSTMAIADFPDLKIR